MSDTLLNEKTDEAVLLGMDMDDPMPNATSSSSRGTSVKRKRVPTTTTTTTRTSKNVKTPTPSEPVKKKQKKATKEAVSEKTDGVSVCLDSSLDTSKQPNSLSIEPPSLDLTASSHAVKITQPKKRKKTKKRETQQAEANKSVGCVSEEKPLKKKRGRKPKQKASTKDDNDTKQQTRKRRTSPRGRKPKKQPATKKQKRASSTTADESPKESKTDAPSVVSKAKMKKLKEKAHQEPVDPKNPNVPKMSVTLETAAGSARSNLSKASQERVIAVHNVSVLQIGPSREEKKATLVSMATDEGVPVSNLNKNNDHDDDADADDDGKKEKKTRSKKEVRVHKLKDIPDSKSWEPETPSEAQADKGEMLPFVREEGKHPGSYKTAAINVALPAPGNRGSELRQTLDSSIFSRNNNADDRAATTTVAEKTKSTPNGNNKKWETDTPQEIADELDQQRMNVDMSSTNRLMRPISELKQLFANQNRLSSTDARTSMLHHISGVIRDKVLTIDAAAKIVSSEIVKCKQEASGGLSADDAEIIADSRIGVNDRLIQRNCKKNVSRDLVLDETQEDVLRVLVDDEEDSITREGTDVPLSQIAAHSQTQTSAVESMSNKKRAMQSVLPRIGLGHFLDEPLDEAEVMLTVSGSLMDGMIYFMSFDDPIAAMNRVFETSKKLAMLPHALDALRRTVSPEKIPDEEYDKMVNRLQAYCSQLKKQFKEEEEEAEAEAEAERKKVSSDSQNKKDDSVRKPSELWIRLSSVKVLLAIMTGKYENDRLNIVRSMVALEEFTRNNLYRGPLMRCFQDDIRSLPNSDKEEEEAEEGGTQDSKPIPWDHGYRDRDVLLTMTELLNKLQRISTSQNGDKMETDDDDDDDDEDNLRLKAFLESGRVVLPDLGTPASMAYCADFLRAPDPDNPLERACVRGVRNCWGYILSTRSAWPATGGLNRAPHAFVPREFYAPDEWESIHSSQTLPKNRNICLLCARFTATYYWVQLRLLEERATSEVIVGNDETDAETRDAKREELRKRYYLGIRLAHSHCNKIEKDHGYTAEDMIPIYNPTNSPYSGIGQPIVRFDSNHYVLGECQPPIDFTKPRTLPDELQPTDPSGVSTKHGKRTVPCFFERRSADFL